jgi:hypothetical protein
MSDCIFEFLELSIRGRVRDEVKRTIENRIENPLSLRLIQGGFKVGNENSAELEDGAIQFDKRD